MAINPATGTTWSVKPGTTTTAELRALGQQFNTAFAAAGMVQTADTGQVNWSTITWVTGFQTWGYEMWRFNDALQATKPVYMRLVYTQVSGSLAMGITAQVGTATDGAGNLTSAPNTNVSVTTANQICIAGAGTPGSAVGVFYIYGDGSSLVFAGQPEKINGVLNTGYGGLFFLERVRHTDGSALGDAVNCMWTSNNGTTVTSQTVLLNNLYAQPASASAGWFPTVGSPFTSGVIGTNMYTFPWFTGISPRLGAPSTMVIGHYRTDMPAGNAFACDHYGASRNFISAAPTVTGYTFTTGGNAMVYPAIRVA